MGRIASALVCLLLDGLCCGTLPPLLASRSGYQTYTTALGRIYNTSEWLDIVLQRP